MALRVRAAHAAVGGAVVAAVVSVAGIGTAAVGHIHRRRRPVARLRVHHSGGYILRCVVHGRCGRSRRMMAIIAQTLVRMGMMRGRRCGIVGAVAGVLMVVPRQRAVAVMVRVREWVVVVRRGGHIIIDHFRRMRSVRVTRHANADANATAAAAASGHNARTTSATHVARRGGHGVVPIVVMIVIGNRRELRIQAVAHGHGTLNVVRRMWIAHEE